MWNASSTVVPVLLVTGPVGVGKTAVLYEADALLIETGSRHATVELEEIARCWSEGTESSRAPLVSKNLAALWSNFSAAGACRLLLAGLLEQRSDLRLVEEAVPGAAVTVVRLHAPLSLLEERIRLREPGSPDGQLDGHAGGWSTSRRSGSRITWSKPLTGRWATSPVRCFASPAGPLGRRPNPKSFAQTGVTSCTATSARRLRANPSPAEQSPHSRRTARGGLTLSCGNARPDPG
jgi:hypothetical protein